MQLSRATSITQLPWLAGQRSSRRLGVEPRLRRRGVERQPDRVSRRILEDQFVARPLLDDVLHERDPVCTKAHLRR